MKYIMIAVMTVMISACGTLGGAVGGLGEDLQAAGKMIKR